MSICFSRELNRLSSVSLGNKSAVEENIEQTAYNIDPIHHNEYEQEPNIFKSYRNDYTIQSTSSTNVNDEIVVDSVEVINPRATSHAFSNNENNDTVQTGCTFLYINLYIFFFCYYAKYGRVRGPGIPGKSPKNSRMKVCSRDTNKFFLVIVLDL